ncbi:Prohibitin-3, mitochondrial [Trifolium repens]|nr:prohibitin-3, mitochondrial [Trifolium repens]WJX72700.1 Prohibitin-3, mitochondrial [Trifolium repens]
MQELSDLKKTLQVEVKQFRSEFKDLRTTLQHQQEDVTTSLKKLVKQVAQQEAERSKFVVMKAEQERRAAIIRAQGESEAAKLIYDATAIAGMGLIELRRIEASREVASTLAKSPDVSYSYLPGGQNLLMALNASS